MEPLFKDELKTEKRGRPKGSKNTHQPRKYISKKVATRKITIQEIFKDRRDYSLGLRKREVISIYKKINYSKVLKLSKEKIDKYWEEISNIRKVLIKEGTMPIITKAFPPQTVLVDRIDNFGDRMLDRRENVYWRASTISDVRDYRAMLDREAKGCHDRGTNATRIVEKGIILQQPMGVKI